MSLSEDNGQGVVQDYKESAKWSRKAAEQGASAQFNLGLMYGSWRRRHSGLCGSGEVVSQGSGTGGCKSSVNLGNVAKRARRCLGWMTLGCKCWFNVAASSGAKVNGKTERHHCGT